MKLDRNINGEVLALHLERRWKYSRVSQKGSHIKLRTEISKGQTVFVPAHKPVRIGTARSILRQVDDHRRVSIQAVLEDL